MRTNGRSVAIHHIQELSRLMGEHFMRFGGALVMGGDTAWESNQEELARVGH
jgi:hypothetical protein